MQSSVRQFIRRFAHFKRQASAGKVVHLVDRKGERFAFVKERPKISQGAARHMFKGKALGPESIPRKEFKGTY